MTPQRIHLDPVDHITVDALGPPGRRVFYMQGRIKEQVVTVIIEKFHLNSMIISLHNFFDEIEKNYPDLDSPTSDYIPDIMAILPPVDPLFRASEIRVGYHEEKQLVAIVITELVLEEVEPEEIQQVWFWCTRSQYLALVEWGKEVISRGRETCPQCQEPIDPDGHFCPKKNGRK